MIQIKHIRLDKIVPPEFDQRLSSDQIADDDLLDSIKELGILEPLLVKDIGGKYEIVFGNRRFTQAGRAGHAAVPCIVTTKTGAELEKIKIHENIKRLPLSHIDQAYTFAFLIKTYNMTETQVATVINKSIAYVSQHLSLLQSDETLIEAVHQGRLNFSQARELMHCKDADERKRLSRICEENGATSTLVKNWVHEANRETDLINHDHDVTKQTYPIADAPVPHYPCAVCNTPTKFDEIRVVRMCHGCHNLFFLQIEQSRLDQRSTIESKAP